MGVFTYVCVRIFVCARVCMCECMRARAWMRVCTCVLLLLKHTCWHFDFGQLVLFGSRMSPSSACFCLLGHGCGCVFACLDMGMLVCLCACVFVKPWSCKPMNCTGTPVQCCLRDAPPSHFLTHDCKHILANIHLHCMLAQSSPPMYLNTHKHTHTHTHIHTNLHKHMLD